MANNGIMEEIRSHLARDKSSAEIIALGFKPSSVRKAQNQLRQLNTKLDQARQLETSGEPATGNLSLSEQLANALDRISELEPQDGTADEWKKKYRELENRLDDNAEAMDREGQDWQEQFIAEEKARNGAEALVAQQSAEIARLKSTNAPLRRPHIPRNRAR